MNVLVNILQNDDLSELKEFVANYNQIDYIVESVPLDADNILKDSPPLISFTCFFQALNCFRFLLAEGASLNISDKKKRLPIHYAAAGGSMEIIMVLYDQGVNIFCRDAQSI